MDFIMEAPIIVATISAATGLLASALMFFLTKKKERDAEWRRQKLDYYKEFLNALNGIATKPATGEDKIRFAEAANNIWLIGSPDVLVKLRAYLLETAKTTERQDFTEHDRLLTALVIEIRKDIGLTDASPVNGYNFILWSTNPREKAEK